MKETAKHRTTELAAAFGSPKITLFWQAAFSINLYCRSLTLLILAMSCVTLQRRSSICRLPPRCAFRVYNSMRMHVCSFAFSH